MFRSEGRQRYPRNRRRVTVSGANSMRQFILQTMQQATDTLYNDLPKWIRKAPRSGAAEAQVQSLRADLAEATEKFRKAEKQYTVEKTDHESTKRTLKHVRHNLELANKSTEGAREALNKCSKESQQKEKQSAQKLEQAEQKLKAMADLSSIRKAADSKESSQTPRDSAPKQTRKSSAGNWSAGQQGGKRYKNANGTWTESQATTKWQSSDPSSWKSTQQQSKPDWKSGEKEAASSWKGVQQDSSTWSAWDDRWSGEQWKAQTQQNSQTKHRQIPRPKAATSVLDVTAKAKTTLSKAASPTVGEANPKAAANRQNLVDAGVPASKAVVSARKSVKAEEAGVPVKKDAEVPACALAAASDAIAPTPLFSELEEDLETRILQCADFVQPVETLEEFRYRKKQGISKDKDHMSWTWPKGELRTSFKQMNKEGQARSIASIMKTDLNIDDFEALLLKSKQTQMWIPSVVTRNAEGYYHFGARYMDRLNRKLLDQIVAANYFFAIVCSENTLYQIIYQQEIGLQNGHSLAYPTCTELHRLGGTSSRLPYGGTHCLVVDIRKLWAHLTAEEVNPVRDGVDTMLTDSKRSIIVRAAIPMNCVIMWDSGLRGITTKSIIHPVRTGAVKYEDCVPSASAIICSFNFEDFEKELKKAQAKTGKS